MPSGVYERKPFTKEHRGNIGKAKKGHEVSEETRRKIIENHDGMLGKRKEGNVTKQAWGYRARKLYEERHGAIPKGHIVHHRDEDITNNLDENHRLFPSRSEHLKYHMLMRRNDMNLNIGIN